MASGLTNIGKIRLLELALRDTQDSAPADTTPLYLALMTESATLSSATVTYDTGAQIMIGNGYTDGGDVLARDGSDITVWDVLDDEAGDYGLIQLADHTWTASGGSLPATGAGARYAVLLDDNATIGDRQVYAYWDLSSARSVQSGAEIVLLDIEIRLT